MCEEFASIHHFFTIHPIFTRHSSQFSAEYPRKLQGIATVHNFANANKWEAPDYSLYTSIYAIQLATNATLSMVNREDGL
jgi:hypothetical protein